MYSHEYLARRKTREQKILLVQGTKEIFTRCTVKKVHEFPVSSRDVTNQTPPGQEQLSYDVIIPAQGEFGSDIPAGDGKLPNLFFAVYAEGVIQTGVNTFA
jgi:hypothetical protein